MIQVTWHFALLIITIIIGFIWAISRDNHNGGGFLGTSRDVAIIIWIILLIVIVPIYGGIFWW